MSRTYALIVNPHAGGGRARAHLDAVQAALAGTGAEVSCALTRSLEHARELTREAAERGQVAVAFGGDGLIGTVASALRGTGGILGVLPGGRGNDFARVLGIPADPAEAARGMPGAREAPIDLGEADGRVFVGIASFGFDSEANRIANQARLVRGNLVYAYGALRALATWRPATFTVSIDGEPPQRHTGYSVAVANSRAYGGGMLIAPDASLDDGLLDVVITGQASKLRFLRLLPSVFRGEHVHHPEVTVMRGRSIAVSADRPFTVYADGDPLTELPATVSVLPAAVRVLLPGS